MIEHARRHGPFDSRYPHEPVPLIPAPMYGTGASGEEAEDRLDWYAFATRFFPTRHRHDLQVLHAYEAYRNGWQELERDIGLRTTRETHRSGAARTRTALRAAALGDWETEGGAPSRPPRRRRRSVIEAAPTS